MGEEGGAPVRAYPGRARLGAERGGLLEECVCLSECGCRLELGEEFAGVLENRGSFVCSAEVDEAAAVAQEGVGVFGDDAEPFPTLGGIGVAVRGCLVVAAGFGDCGGGGDEGVVGVRGTGLVAVSEVVGDVEMIDRKCSPDERGEKRGVLGVGAGVCAVLDRATTSWTTLPSSRGRWV